MKPEGEERKRRRPGVGIWGISNMGTGVCIKCFFLCIFDDDYVHEVCVRNYSIWAINILFTISKGGT